MVRRPFVATAIALIAVAPHLQAGNEPFQDFHNLITKKASYDHLPVQGARHPGAAISRDRVVQASAWHILTAELMRNDHSVSDKVLCFEKQIDDRLAKDQEMAPIGIRHSDKLDFGLSAARMAAGQDQNGTITSHRSHAAARRL